jgi:hypothetical protein
MLVQFHELNNYIDDNAFGCSRIHIIILSMYSSQPAQAIKPVRAEYVRLLLSDYVITAKASSHKIVMDCINPGRELLG